MSRFCGSSSLFCGRCSSLLFGRLRLLPLRLFPTSACFFSCGSRLFALLACRSHDVLKKNKNNFIRTNTVCSCCVSRTKVGLPPRAQCSPKTIQEGIKAFEKMFYFLCPVFLSRFNTFFQKSFVAEYFI